MVLCAVLAMWASLPAWAADASWTVAVSLTTTDDPQLETVAIETAWLGERQRVDLIRSTDTDGAVVWRGMLAGPPLRLLPVSFWVTTATEPTPRRAYFALEVLEYGDQDLHYTVDAFRHRFVHRVVSEGDTLEVRTRDAQMLAGSFGWGLAVMLVLLAASRARPRPGPGLQWTDTRWEPLVWLVLATAWTWPAVVAGGDTLVGRHFDALGTIWFLDAAPRLLPGLSDSLTVWPGGASYQAADSYLLIVWGVLGAWLDPVRLHGWLQVLGVASSGWAASAFAREVGARAPWTLLAGLGFAFSGLAANALLEGHVYHLLNPWMPLFALMWWRATGRDGTVRQGLAAGGFFILTLLTTAYLGVAAAIVAVAFFLDGALRHRGAVAQPAGAALLVVTPVAVLWSLALLTDSAMTPATVGLQIGASDLVHMAGATPDTDLFGHSLAMSLAGLTLAFPFLLRRALRSDERWPVLVVVAVVALVLSAGPVLSDGVQALLPSPFGWVWSLDGLNRLRFPVRLAWAGLLCLSALAAWIATRLFSHRPMWGMVVLVAALVEVFFVVRLPARQAERLASVPSAYSSGEGPVLDLLPTVVGRGGELDSWFNAITCLYQTGHGRAIVENCVRVPISQDEDRELVRRVGALLLEGDASAVRAVLEDAGFTALAVHPDWLFSGDWQRIQPVLALLDPQPEESVDGGARVLLYAPGRPVGSATAPGARRGPASTRMCLQVVSGDSSAASTWMARVADGRGAEQSAVFVDDGRVDGDWPWDGVHTAALGSSPHPDATLTLYEVVDGREQLRWSGALDAFGDDRRMFYQEGDGRVHPVLFALDQSPPGAVASRARVARFGWGLWFMLAGITLVGARRATSGRQPQR